MSNILLPSGRMRRIYYWTISIILTIIMSFIPQDEQIVDKTLIIILPIVMLLLWIFIMMGVQRAHDIGSKLFTRIWVISFTVLTVVIIFSRVIDSEFHSFVGIIVGIVFFTALVVIVVMNILFLFKSGTVGPNEFGEDPRGRSAP